MSRALCLVLATAMIAWLVFVKPREESPGPLITRSARPAPDCIAAGADWQVLAPRHRGGSPAPITVFATPGWLGPVEVRIETRGRWHAAVTSARALSWPPSLPPLRTGEWCSVSISGAHGRSAEAAYLRVALPAGAEGSEPDPLWLGLPALGCLRGGPDLPLAALRAGVSRLPDRGPSDTMSRARER